MGHRTTRYAAALAAFAWLHAASVAAQSVEAAPEPSNAPIADEKLFSEEEWRAYAAGKTLYYSLPQGFVGREYYPPSGDRVVFEYFDGTCFDGTWSFEDQQFCFNYDGRFCFNHLERDGRVYARDIRDGSEQIVTQVTNEILSCAPAAVSEAEREQTRDAARLAAWRKGASE